MDNTSTKWSINEFAASKSGWVVFIGLIAILGISLAGTVWYSQRHEDPLSQTRQQLSSLRDLEAQWEANILSLQLGIAPNYDGVTSIGNELRGQIANLDARQSANPELAALNAKLKAYQAEIEQKSRLVDQVKASYAMLRNAISVIPEAINDCFIHPEVMRFVDQNKRIADLIAESMTAMIGFSISPTPLLRNVVDEKVARVRAAAETVPPELAQAMRRFLAQVEVTVKERLRGNEVLLQISAMPSAKKAADVIAELELLASEEQNAERYVRILMVVLGALTVLSFVGFVHVLSRRFLKLDTDNRILQQVNENVEEQLVQSAKLSALGQMVAGITHEINTPLAYVKAVFELIKERALSEKPTADLPQKVQEAQREELVMLLDDGLHGIEEISTLIRTMKNFSRLDKGSIELFSVKECIESALLLAKPQLKYVADVRTELDNIPPVMASATQIRQVLLNLLVNAADAMTAMDRRGVLIVRARVTTSDTVQIDVCDNGPGIAEEHKTKLFDPFFTTKPVGKGTGMGLSICYRIIENHGGTIAINSKLGKGTIVTVTLPRQVEKHLGQDDTAFIVSEKNDSGDALVA